MLSRRRLAVCWLRIHPIVLRCHCSSIAPESEVWRGVEIVVGGRTIIRGSSSERLVDESAA